MVNGGGDGAALALEAAEVDKNDTKKRRFLRGLRRMFRRRGARGTENEGGRDSAEAREPPTPNTARLLTMDDGHRRKSGSAHQSGLSVSHDSVFTAEASGASGADSDEERARSTSSASDRRRRHHHHHHHHSHGIAAPLTAELAAAVRRRARGDTSEEDEDLGLPRSPPASPPKRGINGAAGVPEQSSCSEGSLLSAGSSHSEEDRTCNSSNHDLCSHNDISDADAPEPLAGLAPLSHSAARHKMAVRPRRTHGAPRRNRNTQMSPGSVLPTTPEVNEEVTRSVTPDMITNHHESSDSTMTSVQHSTSVTSSSRHVVTMSRYEKTESQYSSNLSSVDSAVSHETRLKSSSLPPGLALSQMVGQSGTSPMKLSLSSSEELGNSVKVARSKSNAQKKDSGDFDENISLADMQQSYSERNLSNHHGSSQGMYKGLDMKYNSVLTGELQKRFGSVGEEEELLGSGNFESRSEVKLRKNSDRTEKTERFSENVVQHNIVVEKSSSKNKYQELEESQEKHSNKKDESFFDRLFLRRSGKKNKKDNHNDKDEQIEESRKQSIKEQQSYKTISSETTTTATGRSSTTEHGVIRHQKMMCSDQHAHKSIGQKVFSNQSHKRIDPRGGYVNDPMIQESMNNFSKGSATEYGINDYKHFSDREKLASDIQFSQSKSKEDVNVRRLSSENITKGGLPQQSSRMRQRLEPMDIPASPEPQRKPPLLPRSSPQESKSFFPTISQGKVYPSKDIVNGSRYVKNSSSKHLSPSEDFPHSHPISPKIKMNENAFGFASTGSSHHTKPVDSSIKPLSYSVSPPRTIWPQNYDPSTEYKSSSQGSLDPPGLRHSKSDYETRYFDYPGQLKNDHDVEHSKARPKIAGLSSYQQKISQIGNMENDSDLSFPDSGSSRNPVVKSHSFRLNSDVIPIASQQDMPSLPPMFGISESSMDSWESTYKKNIKEASDLSSLELGSDSLMNYNYKNNTNTIDGSFTEESVFAVSNTLDMKENLLIDDLYSKQAKPMTHFAKNVQPHSIKARDDISRIEANIDSIIGNPKPLNCISLKSSSLDSVKSYTEKSSEHSRKAYSNESISNGKIYLNQPAIPDVVGSVSFTSKLSPEANLTMSGSADNLHNLKSVDPAPNEPVDNHVSVTVLNNTETSSIPVLKTPDTSKMTSQTFDFTTNDKTSPKPKETKIFEKLSPSKSSVPEFMKIQLNKVDQKPASNVVLSTSALLDSKNKTTLKTENISVVQQPIKRSENVERSVSYEPKKTEKIACGDLKKSESLDKNIMEDIKELTKPHRKFSSEDVEILEKSDINAQNNAYNIQLKKTGSQSLLNRSTEILSVDNSIQSAIKPENRVSAPTSLNLRKSSAVSSTLPPPSPTAHKNFIKKKSGTFDYIETNCEVLKRQSYPVFGTEQKPLENSPIDKSASSQNIKRMSSNELLVEQNSRIDRSSSSSDDCNLENTVVFRKKSISSMVQNRSGTRKDDEPELMKVFARRSLKLKDSETDAITQDIMKITNTENENNKEEQTEDNKRSSKHDFSVTTRSRDSDKENEADSPKDERKKSISGDVINDSANKIGGKNIIEYRKHTTETAELMQAQRMPKKLLDSNPVSINNATNIQPVRPMGVLGFTGYQRSISANIPLLQANVNNTKVENNNKTEVTNYKKEVADLTPEKRFRNRTFPDSSNENKADENKTKIESSQHLVDTSSLPKKPWSHMKSEENLTAREPLIKPLRKSSFATPTTEVKVIPSTNNKIVSDKSILSIHSKITSEKLPPLTNNKIVSDKVTPAVNINNKLNIDKVTPLINNKFDKQTNVTTDQANQEIDEKATKGTNGTEGATTENGAVIGEADASPQFKGIHQMRAEWERRCKQ